MCAQGLLVSECQARKLCHIGLQATTTEISSYMIRQSYQKICHCPRARMCYMHDGAVRDVHNNTYHDRWIGRGAPLHGLHARQIWTLWIFTLCMQFLLTTKRHFTIAFVDACQDYPQLPRHLRRDAVAHDMCRFVHWTSWRTLSALIINVLFQL
jgi:hypothetical protein